MTGEVAAIFKTVKIFGKVCLSIRGRRVARDFCIGPFCIAHYFPRSSAPEEDIVALEGHLYKDTRGPGILLSNL